MGWSWRQTYGKPSKQDLVAIPVGHCIARSVCWATGWENSFSSLAPDFSRFALPLAHIFIAKISCQSPFSTWVGVSSRLPTAGIRLKCFSSDAANRWPSPPGLLGFILEKGSLKVPKQVMHLLPFDWGEQAVWKKLDLRLAEVSRSGSPGLVSSGPEEQAGP